MLSPKSPLEPPADPEGLPASVAASLHAVIYRQRELAYLHVDAALNLVGAGGHLENYGLADLQLGRPVCDQAHFLEGMLPPIETPHFVRSVELMTGRAAELQFYLDSGDTWVLLLDVTAERDETRRVQQRAYDMILLREEEALLNRRLEAANAALRATQVELENSRSALAAAHTKLQAELTEAANYVRTLLPAPQSEPFAVDWRFTPSAALGGDGLGYHWIDAGHFALYLLDVCGHGVGPSLMSVAVLHMLRSASLRDVDLRRPARVLGWLNDSYQMQAASDLYFTLWYGVYVPTTRTLEYACGGHPPALLMSRDGSTVQPLKARGVAVGLAENVVYESQKIRVPTQSRLYLLSDGAFELERPDGRMLEFAELVEFLRHPPPQTSELDGWFNHLLQLRGVPQLDDDFTIARFDF
jgi:sigma-B regulation protein RsbU (phosphoserine phosphatase)